MFHIISRTTLVILCAVFWTKMLTISTWLQKLDSYKYWHSWTKKKPIGIVNHIKPVLELEPTINLSIIVANIRFVI